MRNMRPVVLGWFVVVSACGVVSAQTVNKFPTREDPLHARVSMFDALMRGNHWNEGTMMQDVIFPPAGVDKPYVGSQEDCCGISGQYLAAYSLWYAATGDEQVRKWADTVMGGILKLEKVTGVPGVVARAFYKSDTPLWHEQAYFFPMEWHASTSMPGYRWEGDLSSDKFVDLFFGCSTYFDFCADEAHRKIAADFIDRFVGRVVDYNFKMVDVDNKMTLWGNFCPDLPHTPLNALEMLAGLKAAWHMTGKDRYRAAYQMLIDRYHYDEQAILAKVLFPPEWMVPWDDDLAAKSYYPLMRYEEDRTLLIRYRMGLDRHWYYWKTVDYSRPDDIFHTLLYQVLTGESVVDEKCVNAIRAMWGFDRTRGTFTIPSPEGTKTVESEEEGEATALVLNYWFGRYYGLIDPAW